MRTIIVTVAVGAGVWVAVAAVVVGWLGRRAARVLASTPPLVPDTVPDAWVAEYGGAR